MSLNRRAMLGASLAISAVSLLPKVALAEPDDLFRPNLPPEPTILLYPSAQGHKFESLACSWCNDRIKEGVLRFEQEWVMPLVCKLESPVFKIEAGPPVWNYMTGDTDEQGLSISITEWGTRNYVHLCDTRIATSRGEAEYWGTPPQNPMPLYYVRNRHVISYERCKEIEKLLPPDHIGLDTEVLNRILGTAANA